MVVSMLARSGCIMVLSMLALWQRRWWQQLRHYTVGEAQCGIPWPNWLRKLQIGSKER